MATNYPASLDDTTSLPRPTSSTAMDAAGYEGDVLIGNLSDAVTAVETELGTDPAGAFTTVKLRLDSLTGPQYAGDVAVGESVYARSITTGSNSALTSGILYLQAFTARKSEAVASLVTVTGDTGAGATPTLGKMGFYSVGGTGELTDGLTLLGVTANDTAMWATAYTSYSRALTTPTTKTAGLRYAIGILCVSGASMPKFFGQTIPNAVISGLAPWQTTALSGQTDITADVTSTLAAGTRMFFAATLPT